MAALEEQVDSGGPAAFLAANRASMVLQAWPVRKAQALSLALRYFQRIPSGKPSMRPLLQHGPLIALR